MNGAIKNSLPLHTAAFSHSHLMRKEAGEKSNSSGNAVMSFMLFIYLLKRIRTIKIFLEGSYFAKLYLTHFLF